MKFRSSCCCWLTLLLVGSSVISVSPNSSTTTITTFQQTQQQNRRQQSMVLPVYTEGAAQRSKRLLNSPTTITNKLKSLENYLFTSTTISLEAAPTTKHPVTSVQQQLLTLASSSSPPTSRTTSSSLDKNSIKPWKQSHSGHGTAVAAAASVSSSVTGAMVYHHYSERKPTESYPSMFFQINSDPRRQYLRDSARKRIQRDAEMNDEDGGIDKCLPFVQGDPDQNTLYNPDYPNNYPKNINCTRIIEAPRGQLIRLDFRNSFNIEEKEDCKFDYLEIRNGPYGFSNLIGRFCGEEFPPMITSNERHLWLHFHSDESIEYSGFTAVYEFIDRPKEAISTELNCTIESQGYQGFINSTDVPEYVISNVTKYKIPLDCMWIIRVQENWKISVKFINFNLNRPNDCDTNFIDIFGEHTNIPSRVKNFCGSTGEAVSSESNILHIRFFAEQKAINSTFKILYTAFRDKGTAQNCAEDEYDCQDTTCIWGGLVCNSLDNCKFRWDEEGCPESDDGQTEHVTIIIVVFGLILGGMIMTFLVNCIRKIMRDQKIIREHIRQSKESKLDEIGRSSKARSRDNVSGVLSPRQKHSQTSLQILDDVSQRYYREVVPISVQTGKTDLKDHSILRHHHDMVVQTSLCDDSSTPDRGLISGGDSGGMIGGVCEMGCQTRESLFQPQGWQKPITSSSPHQSTAAAIRFSTFGYEVPPPPPIGFGQKSGTLSRQSSTNNRQPSESIELEERLRTASHHPQHHHSHSHLHGGGGSVGSGDPCQAPTMRQPQEMCHHHHQHQQHLQKHQMQQQQQQQLPPNIGTMGSHQHSHHQVAPGGGSGGGGGKMSGGKHKHDETSKVFIDIRNSAPDVIIMTSH